MDAKGIDLEITDKTIRINGVKVLVADEPIEISPIGHNHLLTATLTLFVNKLIVQDSRLDNPAT